MDKFLILNDSVGIIKNKTLFINQMLDLMKPHPSLRKNILNLGYHPILELIIKKQDLQYIWITNFTHSHTIKVYDGVNSITKLGSHKISNSCSYIAPINILMGREAWNLIIKGGSFEEMDNMLLIDKSQAFDTYILPDRNILYKNHSKLLYLEKHVLHYQSNFNTFYGTK